MIGRSDVRSAVQAPTKSSFRATAAGAGARRSRAAGSNDAWASSIGIVDAPADRRCSARSCCSIDGKRLRRPGRAESCLHATARRSTAAEIGQPAAWHRSAARAAYRGRAGRSSPTSPSDPSVGDSATSPLSHGLRACWSIPIMTRRPQGARHLRHVPSRAARADRPRPARLVDLVTQTAALVIDRERGQRRFASCAASPADGAQSSSSS